MIDNSKRSADVILGGFSDTLNGVGSEIQDLFDSLLPIQDFVNAILRTLQGDLTAMPRFFADWLGNLPWLGDFFDWEFKLPDFGDILDIVGGLLDPTGVIRSIFLPDISLDRLTDRATNLIPDGSLNTPPPEGHPEGTWYWSSEGGRNDTGCAAVDASSETQALLFQPTGVTPGKALTISVWTSSKNPLYAANSKPVRVKVSAYRDQELLSTQEIGTADPPIVVWSLIEGSWTPPPMTTHAVLTIEVTPAMESGTVLIDDVSMTNPDVRLPQTWIDGLLDDLGIIGDGIQLATQMVNQIIQIAGGIVVTPINAAVQMFKDGWSGVGSWIQDIIDGILSALRGIPVFGGIAADVFSALTGFKNKTEGDHQTLNNAVYSGAVLGLDDTEFDRSENDVQQAVAALRARSEALRSENELRYSSAIPIWQGLVPGGDVTCSVDDLLIAGGTSADIVIKTLNLTLTGRTARNTSGTDTHDHYLVTGGGTSGGTTELRTTRYGLLQAGPSGPMSTFRARSDSTRKFITFQGWATGVTTELRCLLWSYDYDNDNWMVVARSKNVASELSTAEPLWIDAELENEYVPQVGELMAVSWRLYSGAPVNIAQKASLIVSPAYQYVPHGNAATISDPGGVGLTAVASNWRVGSQLFAQVAPGLGQGTAVVTPTYFFDDFGKWRPADYVTRGGVEANNFNGGNFHIEGGILPSDGNRIISPRKQMNTEAMRVSAHLGGTTAYPLPSAAMLIHCDSNIGYGVSIDIWNDRVVMGRVGADGSATEVGRASNTNTPARFELEYLADSKIYVARRNGDAIITWSDPSNLAGRSRGRRGAALIVRRGTFVNSGPWDDFLVEDVVTEESEDPEEES